MERFLAKKADLREKVLDVGCGSSRFLRVGLDALKEWTGRSRLSVVYDSAVDGMTVCDMFQRVRGKRNVAVIGTTTAGDVFGGFYSVAMTREDVIKDPNAFVFSFKSHVPCRVLQQCVVKTREGRDLPSPFLNRTAFGGLRLGMAVTHSRDWICQFVDSSVLHLPQDVKDLLWDSRDDAHGRRTVLGGCPGHVHILASHARCARVSQCI